MRQREGAAREGANYRRIPEQNITTTLLFKTFRIAGFLAAADAVMAAQAF